MNIQEEYFTPHLVTEKYFISKSTLAKWRMANINLPYSKIGKYIRYKRSDIEAFIEANMVAIEGEK
ncbi:MAG TPA: excisionase [Sulfurovum sp. UBA12169]|nr:MAG TPA: excisionase [Sulfurovum sp. UBA12169]